MAPSVVLVWLVSNCFHNCLAPILALTLTLLVSLEVNPSWFRGKRSLLERTTEIYKETKLINK